MSKDDFEKYKVIAELVPGKIEGLEEAGISSAEVAKELEVTEGSVKSWRLGAIPTERSLAKLNQLVVTKLDSKHDFGMHATVPQTIAALSFAGFSDETIAEVAGVTPNTVSNWLNAKTRPNTKHRNKLENLRSAMGMLVDAELEPDTAAIWMQSPIGDNVENIPLEELGQNPENVFEAIDLFFVRPYKPN